MSNVITNVVVEQVSTKPVTTKFGVKATYSFKAAGSWFRTNFKNHNLSAGDVVSFEYEDSTYGAEVDVATISKGAVAVGTGASPPVSTGHVAPARASNASYSSKGVFPIPALDGQRSIVRQNALTNARELVMHSFKPGSLTDPNDAVSTVIGIARQFEAYTTGDMDAEEVAAEMAEAKDQMDARAA